jgi:opacity protein-like surface antigen
MRFAAIFASALACAALASAAQASNIYNVSVKFENSDWSGSGVAEFSDDGSRLNGADLKFSDGNHVYNFTRVTVQGLVSGAKTGWAEVLPVTGWEYILFDWDYSNPKKIAWGPPTTVTLPWGAKLKTSFLTASAAPKMTSMAFTPVSGGAGAVPEPAAWSLMIFGIGAVGAALRRRRLALAA